MWMLAILALILFVAFGYREQIVRLSSYLMESRLKTKVSLVLFFITVFLLIYPEVIPLSLTTVGYIYLFGLTAFQGWSIWKAGKEFDCPWPKGSTTAVICSFLVLWSPLADLIANRSYDSKAGVIFAATSLSFLILYTIEVIQRNQHHFQESGDSPDSLGS